MGKRILIGFAVYSGGFIGWQLCWQNEALARCGFFPCAPLLVLLVTVIASLLINHRGCAQSAQLLPEEPVGEASIVSPQARRGWEMLGVGAGSGAWLFHSPTLSQSVT